MSIKAYFSGKSGVFFWCNILLMVVVVIGGVLVAFGMIGSFTHHGEQIEVPNVAGNSMGVAASAFEKANLRYAVADSMYNAKMPAGVVLEQNPRAGSRVRSGRVVYLTINMKGEPLVKFPDLVNNSSLREAEAQLRSLGFSLTPPERVEGQPRDFVVGIRQGSRAIHAGEMVSRDRALTIRAGAGEAEDSLEVDDLFDVDAADAGVDLDF